MSKPRTTLCFGNSILDVQAASVSLLLVACREICESDAEARRENKGASAMKFSFGGRFCERRVTLSDTSSAGESN
jgi:hypothetical protein